MKKIIIFLLTISCTLQLFAQGTFNVSSGTFIKPGNGTDIVFNNVNFVNNGTLLQAPGATFKFAGSGTENISGSGADTIDHLLLAKNAGVDLALQSNIVVTNEVNFTSGLLNVGNNNVDLGTTAVLNNESEASRAYSTGTTGFIQSTGILNAPSSVNLGNLGAIITSAANLGSTTIKRTFNTYAQLSNSNIFRDYIITPTTDAGLNATFRFTYFDMELNGDNENMLDLLQSPDNGTTWNDIGFTTRDAVNNYVEKTGIDSFSTWTLTPPSTILATTMGPLNAYQENNSIELNWQVYSDENVNAYEIQRSIDGKKFVTIGKLAANNTGNYTYPDNSPVTGNNYYRLIIVDKDGSTTYSNIDVVNLNDLSATISFYPNPVVDREVTLQLANIAKGNYQLVVFDNTGKQVYASVIDYTGGYSAQTIYLPANISSGIYKVQLKNAAVIFNQSLLVK
ncbi:MAG TPA: T9SS type A sorting domain-containing protein [Ferruginibacter sp.]|nr:T9SS type A sorting domain-containing protein [Ferruginibacter sp.]